jgi:hypothetical protein
VESWAWGVAARAAYASGDDAESDGLFAWFDAQGSAPVPPILQTERALALARQAARREDPAAKEKFVLAIADQRRRSSPYHLAHGLLDYTEHLIDLGRGADTAEFIAEAQEIAERLGAKPLLARATAIRAGEMIPN